MKHCRCMHLHYSREHAYCCCIDFGFVDNSVYLNPPTVALSLRNYIKCMVPGKKNNNASMSFQCLQILSVYEGGIKCNATGYCSPLLLARVWANVSFERDILPTCIVYTSVESYDSGRYVQALHVSPTVIAFNRCINYTCRQNISLKTYICPNPTRR